ncbi:MAG: glycine C-acetyltransferase [Saccharofermentanales bacterium]
MKSAIGIINAKNDEIRSAGLWKSEGVITGPQQAWIDVDGRKVLNLCSNNYLGLCSNPDVIIAAENSYAHWGYGLSSVRFICGTQEIHKRLEEKVSEFLHMEDTLLYTSCFDANGGLFETLLTEQDAIISDQLNHASIIDGIRLCKARRYRYANNDMQELEARLAEADRDGARIRLIATDGVFSMDGYIADLKGICDLADKYDALVMVDDSHAVGFIGSEGRGTPEHCGVAGRVDILTGTFGKALGGASGGYTSASKPIIDLLRQRSRPYLFSNTLAPAIAAATIKVFDMLMQSTELRDRLEYNTGYFRKRMVEQGFDIPASTHPIVPVMLYDAAKAKDMAARMFDKGVYVGSFFYPVVPEGKARIRTQISALHTLDDLDFAVESFIGCRSEITSLNA